MFCETDKYLTKSSKKHFFFNSIQHVEAVHYFGTHIKFIRRHMDSTNRIRQRMIERQKRPFEHYF